MPIERDSDQTRVAVVDHYSGKVLDNRYKVEFQLASGGFGAVYRARHVINGREVAIKILHADLAKDQGVAARFRREAAALGQLKNPHIVTAYDFGQAPDGTLYIVMELLSGMSLDEVYRSQGPLAWRRVASIMVQACRALGEAHTRGIVHRDLKPANIHLEKRGVAEDYVKVLDFGIAKIMHGSALDAAGLTHAGQVIGTFDYMAPEQLAGGEISGRTDIFTLGVVMYEMISGEHPFGVAVSPAAMISAILSVAPLPLSTRAPVPVAFDEIAAKCLQWEPDRRYATVAELASDLETVLASDDEHTKTKVQATVFPPEDATNTWINAAPEPDTLPPKTPEPDLYTTLPGVGPPKRKK
jgi:serine/threonine-protein kinase